MQGDPSGPARSLFESLVGTFGERAHAAAELATGQKVAAVAATAAVAAGGGAGVKELAVADHPPVPRYHRAAERSAQPDLLRAPNPAPAAAAPKPTTPQQPQPAPQPAMELAPTGSPTSPSPPAPSPSGGGGASGDDSGGGEFGP
jgi:hypothetical protein